MFIKYILSIMFYFYNCKYIYVNIYIYIDEIECIVMCVDYKSYCSKVEYIGDKTICY